MTIYKTVSESKVQMTELILPQHTNALGTVFGGVVLSWVDIAASICAQRHCEKTVVTASFDTMHFLAPIKLGWIANISASINFTSKSSVEVEVKITAENPMKREFFHTGSAYITMVALDGVGRPAQSIPQIKPESEAEIRRYSEAKQRREIRLANKKKATQKP